MNKFINEKLMPPMMKFLNTKAVTAIKNGMLYPIPFIIIGAIFLILANFPQQNVADWISQIGWTPIFNQAYAASFGIMALFATFGIAYSWVKSEGFEGASAGLTAIIVMVMLQPSSISTVTKIIDGSAVVGEYQVNGVIDAAWLGGKGMILAIVGGLLVGWSYSWFMKKNIRIKLPEQVPANVADSFGALIPAFAITFGAMLVYALSVLTTDQTPIEWIYTLIQTPLQHVADGPLGVFLIAFLPVFIWWFGVHGATVIGGIMSPLLLANNADNLKLFQEGKLSLEHGAHIVTQAFMDQFITVTGSGMTFGFVIFMIYRARSVQMRTIGKLTLAPAFFNINEPVLFGMPIVLNPILAFPFLIAPLVSGFGTYAAIALHIIPPFNGMYVPWTTPPILSGLIVGGWQGALWQALMIFVTGIIYWPFAKKYDAILVQQEKEAYEAEQAEQA
ncbi:MAG TPA: PTS cellobiose transporter subunit IIC [Lactococcus sp.]|uniref:Permease IIC component n=1 Tax=Lactococcus muris TaxID=2941330 RepID=A0ABV4DDV3_9LACT|nr:MULTISPECIES: PTS sugar transporter subunit IIC [Lactococcus]MBL3716766.1 PTS sugar transporter subunit IIC [Lactococcus garvieae]HAP14828.1 PTS cellobiose transporter subunit IIC [Lactococcus sp.]HBC91094.1 PTS cellobiose transporter subunit IIC [Lactococcus sp.]